jgi:hypothetical protein
MNRPYTKVEKSRGGYKFNCYFTQRKRADRTFEIILTIMHKDMTLMTNEVKESEPTYNCMSNDVLDDCVEMLRKHGHARDYEVASEIL